MLVITVAVLAQGKVALSCGSDIALYCCDIAKERSVKALNPVSSYASIYRWSNWVIGHRCRGVKFFWKEVVCSDLLGDPSVKKKHLIEEVSFYRLWEQGLKDWELVLMASVLLQEEWWSWSHIQEEQRIYEFCLFFSWGHFFHGMLLYLTSIRLKRNFFFKHFYDHCPYVTMRKGTEMNCIF